MPNPTMRHAIGMIAALSAAGVPALAVHAAPGHARYRAQPHTCSALGIYHIGSRVLPVSPPHGAQPPRGRQLPAQTAIVEPVSALLGTLTITAYSGCGQPTAGAFSAHRLPYKGPIQPYHRESKALPCAEVCWWPPAGVITATGTFSQDALHPHDPLYVSVSATLVVARPGPMLGMPCSVKQGCPPRPVITSTTTFAQVTGYLQVALGAQSAVLTFLPPPSAGSTTAPAALTLQGWRGPVVSSQ